MRRIIASTIIAATAALGLGAFAHAGGETPIDATRKIAGLEWPTFVTHAPGDPDRLFILEKRGRLRVYIISQDRLLALPMLDIDSIVFGGTSTNNEQGLLGLAFHPDFQENGHFFLNYTGGGGATVVRRYTLADPSDNVVDPSTAQTVITFTQPFSNHNGGWLGFGPDDGYLYIATGDGGSGNDPGNRAQDITSQRLGKMLRLDVDSATPYGIPADNPFVGTTGDDEIFHYGLRNPWRPSFDRETGDLWIADVGQNAREEINVLPAGTAPGQNFGWRCKEGDLCTGLSGCSCSSSALVDPIRTYIRSCSTGGFSVTGGYVYRGCAIPDLQGTYFYADFVCGNFWSLRWTPDGGVTDFRTRSELKTALEGGTINQISSFGEDFYGELYIVDQGSGGTSGAIYKIVPASGEVECVEENPADLNGDGVVDGQDLGIMLGNWNGKGTGDINGDGQVDGQDLGILLGSWTTP